MGLLLLPIQSAWQQNASPKEFGPKVANAQIANEDRLIRSLASTDRREGLGAAIELRLDRKALVAKLLNIINSTNSVIQKLPAIVVLGEYRVSQAGPILVQHLEWDDAVPGEIAGVSQATIEKMSLECCPVRLALQEIGEPAIPLLLGRITETDDAKIIEKCAFICYQIEGADITQFRMQQILVKESDSKRKDRLKSALNALEKIKR